MSEWPKYDLSLDLLSGACEVGKELYLIGSFGGFGGSFFSVHRSYEEARKECDKIPLSSGQTIYKLSLPVAIKHIHDGKEIEE